MYTGTGKYSRLISSFAPQNWRFLGEKLGVSGNPHDESIADNSEKHILEANDSNWCLLCTQQ
jgi:hypothetical protein